jgi:hypothetical protein
MNEEEKRLAQKLRRARLLAYRRGYKCGQEDAERVVGGRSASDIELEAIWRVLRYLCELLQRVVAELAAKSETKP